MKNRKIISGLAMAILVLAGACKKDFLNTEPQNEFSSESTWTDGPLAQAFIYNVYSYLGYGGYEEQALAAYTDEAMFTHAGRNINTFTEAAETPSNPAWSSITYNWNNMYEAIRDANIAINRLPTATFDDQPLKDRLLGEAYFLRGYYYHQLMRFYGGVPLVKRPYGLNEDYSIERSSFDATVSSIISDLDSAILLLDGKTTTPGRASELSAKALKSRVLLYAASDLHDANTAKAKSPTISSYSNIELLAYTSGDRNARWQAAKTAAKAVLDEGQGYKLGLSAPVSALEGKNNYISLAMGGGSKAAEADAAAAAELIFYRTLSGLYTQESQWPLGGLHYGINNGPNGY
ncbi:RagB/SusD family nutrient uptake outer membrane protein, partial [Flavihumibacter sp. CACIAM 22H1]|uniref:RagB/SusD family nutrient uptake outer membrane protein n=1 Tax=Flavihumibacter sp. CACIAM 22H1 TaxID=1812911 RepID=UPI0025BFEC74